MLTSASLQNKRTITVIIATIINVTLNIILIPQYSIKACAIVSLVTNIFVAILFRIFLQKNNSISSKIFLPEQFMVILCLWLAVYSISIYLENNMDALLISTLVIIIILFYYLFSSADRKKLKNIIYNYFKMDNFF